MSPDAAPRRVYLHIGLPKTGTTFLQTLLEENRAALRARGLLYPLPHREAHFHAAVEVRGSHERWGLPLEQVAGTWDLLAGRARAFPGSSVISHENLSGADADQVARAVAALPGLELHVVVTVRDLARQITAGWQEGIKNGSVNSFAAFSGKLLADLRADRREHRFWRMQDLPAVLAPWAAATIPDRVHVVTAPKPGADRLELWRRFAAAVGFDPDGLQTEVRRANESLGVAPIALLRDVNRSLRDRMDTVDYRHVVKRYFAQQLLPAYESPRARYPRGPLHEEVVRLSERWRDYLRDSGFRVHGDLADLVPDDPGADVPPPDRVDDAAKYALAHQVVAELLQEVARLRREAAAAPAPPATRVRRGISRLLGRNAVARG